MYNHEDGIPIIAGDRVPPIQQKKLVKRAPGAPRLAGFPSGDESIAPIPVQAATETGDAIALRIRLEADAAEKSKRRGRPGKHHGEVIRGMSRIESTGKSTVIYCSTSGCENRHETTEPVYPTAVFTCREHNPQGDAIHFQPYQFDKRFGGHTADKGTGPASTNTQVAPFYSSHRELRKFLDKDDPMITDGHQVLKERQIERKCPDWMKSGFEVRSFLIKAFPKMLNGSCDYLGCDHKACKQTRKQWNKGAIWYSVIYYYHLMGLPASYTAEILDKKETVIARVVIAIDRFRAGRRVDGTLRAGKPGRKKAGTKSLLTGLPIWTETDDNTGVTG